MGEWWLGSRKLFTSIVDAALVCQQESRSKNLPFTFIFHDCFKNGRVLA